MSLRFKKLLTNTLFLILPACLSIQSLISVAKAEENFVITPGVDKTFTEFNYHYSEIQVGNPTAPEVASIGNTAYVHALANAGHIVDCIGCPGGKMCIDTEQKVAQAIVGAKFTWDSKDYSGDGSEPVRVTMDFSYRIEFKTSGSYDGAWALIELRPWPSFNPSLPNDNTVPPYESVGTGISPGTEEQREGRVSLSATTTVGAFEYIGAYIQAGAESSCYGSSYGNVDITINSIKIEFPGWSENKPPVASFIYSPENAKVNDEITFDASSSSDPDGTIVKYDWSFGDGSTAEGVTTNHVYTQAGDYTVTLTVTDDKGASNSTSLNLTVAEKENKPPVASFTYSPEVPLLKEEISFDASSSNDPDGTIVRYTWDFGDGTTAEGVNVKHNYAKEGAYTVTLTVTDNKGLTGYSEVNLTVGFLEILDGADFSAGDEVSDDPTKIVSGGTVVEGAVTDGVTRLLLRLSVDKFGPVTFTLQGTGNPKEDGVLRSINNKLQKDNTVTVNTVEVNGKQYAFVIYQVPENFVRKSVDNNYDGKPDDEFISERTISIKVEYNNSTPIEKQIRLVRPPLILVHGLWSSADMWDEFKVILRNKIPDLQIYTVDYKRTNASHLAENAGDKAVPYNCEGDSITKAKTDFKTNKIAIVQIDILGHSMGGVLGRIRVEGDMWSGVERYHQELNFQQGDINKLITLDSPHFGSFLADFAMGFVNSLDPLAKELLFKKAKKRGFALDQGAIEDLTTMSPPIIYLNSVPTDSLSHSIAGDFVVNVDLSLIPGRLGILFRLLKEFGYNTSIDRIPIQSDLVVSVKSQTGGLAFPASSSFNHHHCAATTEEVADKVIELLNADPVDSSLGIGFPVNKWPEWFKNN